MGEDLLDAVWDAPYSFLLRSVDNAELTMTLHRPVKKQTTMLEKARNSLRQSLTTSSGVVGSISYDLLRLMRFPRLTDTAYLPLEDGPARDTGLVKLRLQLRALQHPIPPEMARIPSMRSGVIWESF